ncbi:reverse transcriptase family protein [Williamsia phyllosphaerae]|uniref:RNA-directed DNA polymerase n=1 Tax=Williamsia phyllosphaerae TaxID=885042 RepID=A0ABQ1V1K3_9NOCA|nr:reverse transcriptase family protein [Williamsia phyllosphaerae]GGF32002.1 hypothetical protein GCM10007298_29840 [Williamsia phyllosphaerae]
MSDPLFSPDEAAEIAAHVEAHLTAWTWPEMQRALIAAGLSPEFADVVGLRLFDPSDDVVAGASDIESRILGALRDRTAPLPETDDRSAPAVWELTEPSSTGRVRDDLPDIYDVEQLAHWLNFTVPELEWFADRGRWLRNAREPLRHYRVFRVEKRDGFRVIEAPKPRMRETQRRLLRRLVERIPPHPAARGFVRGSSTAAFAWPHTDRPVVLRVDLRHCFESIDARRVRHVFSAAGCSPAIARILTELCTTATPPDAIHGLDPVHAGLLRERHLPQGAPTSPHLANLVLRGMDRRLAGFAAHNDLRYTRYGDDLALSGDRMDADRVLWTVLRVVADEGFTVHPAKTRIMHAHQQQRLAGLVVNDRPQVSRADHDALRALLHNAIRTGGAAQNHDGHPDFRAHVYGKIAWIGATSPARRDKLLDMASHVDW